jgi:N-acetylmuramoyl-L-alanine amidase
MSTGTPTADRNGPRRRLLAALAVAAGVATALQAQQPGATISAIAVRSAIERALSSAPRGFDALYAPLQTGVRVLAVDVRRSSAAAQRITIDLSQKALTYDPSGDVELIIDHVLRSTAPLTAGGGEVEYRFLVEGLPLDHFFPRAAPPSTTRVPGNGGRVVISAGHGWYWHEESATWRLQRDHYWDIVEDLVNWEIANTLRDSLRNTRFDAVPARYPARDARHGPSGHLSWQESAVYFIKSLGAPSAVWDIGINDYARDINSRPLYANWIDSALIVSIHNNGGGGTGTETWYDESNGSEGESRRLAEIINNRVVTAIRRHYNANWPDRGLRSCNGCKGENRLAERPAIILEVAFMDTKSPDNAALHDEKFKQIVAYAIRDGLHEWAGLKPPDD